MQKIYKYGLELEDEQTIEMPLDAQILSVANQRGVLCLWAMVIPGIAMEKRTIEIIGTGNPIASRISGIKKFIGTVVIEPFVWHVFEIEC